MVTTGNNVQFVHYVPNKKHSHFNCNFLAGNENVSNS